MSKKQINFSVLFNIFTVAAAVISMEITMTRLFSAVLRYHFVFLVISIAVCGIGLGGLLNALIKKTNKMSLGHIVLLIGWSALLFVILLLKVILPLNPEALWLIALITIIPYIFAGLFFARIFSDYSSQAATLYAADLVGAGLASFIIVFVLQSLGALNAMLAVVVFLFFIVLFNRRERLAAAICTLCGAAVLITNVLFSWLDISAMPTKDTGYAKMLFSEMAEKKGTKIIHTVWDAFARTDVVEDPEMGEDVLLVYTNGHVPTYLIRYDKKSKQFTLGKNIADIPFEWRQSKKILCIGPGGGMDVLIARRHGAEHIDGVEINPAIADIIKIPDFKEYYGDLYGQPGNNLYISDGRTFVERSRQKYDAVFMSLAKTATGATGIALVEGYIYTVEAVENYLKALNEQGMIVFVTDGYIANIRLFLTAVKALQQRQNLTFRQAVQHIALISVPQEQRVVNPYEFALIVSKSPISPKGYDKLAELTRNMGCQTLFVPGHKMDKTFRPLLKKNADIESFARDFYQQWRKVYIRQSKLAGKKEVPVLNILPATDDKPFFLDFSFGIPKMLKPLLYITLTIWVCIGVLLFMMPFVRKERAATGLSFGYFSCLGIAFMMVEIPLIQKLILILGHPVYALCVVLFALLLGGGLGSYISQHRWLNQSKHKNAVICLGAGVICIMIAYYLNLPKAWELSLSLPLRIVWAALLSALMGVFLGMPFPTGIHALGNLDKRLIPWMWGVNGICSVCGSVLAAVGAKVVGFQMVFICGAMIYFLAMLLSSDRWRIEH